MRRSSHGELYGRSLSRRDVAAHAGMLSQFAGVRLMTLGDGVERGIRMLEFRTGTGLRFTVLVDRALDIADCEYKRHGDRLAFADRLPPSGPARVRGRRRARLAALLLGPAGDLRPRPHPVHARRTRRTTTSTCPRKTVDTRSTAASARSPGRLTGYGERWDGDECTLWCEGIVQQSAVFGEDLHLIRRIEAKVGTQRIRHQGPRRQPRLLPDAAHVLLSHQCRPSGAGRRLALPGADPPTRLGGPCRDAYQQQNVGYRTLPAPQRAFTSRSGSTRWWPTVPGACRSPLVNEVDHGRGLGFVVESRKARVSGRMYEWQNFQAGQYAIGIEPSTNHVLGKPFAKERGELIWLEHGDERSYTTRSCRARWTPTRSPPAERAHPRHRRPASGRLSGADGPVTSRSWMRHEGGDPMNDFSGKTILYTGAAGGLGLPTTVLLPRGRRHGHRGRQRSGQDRRAGGCRGWAHGPARLAQLDLSDLTV